MLVQGTVLPYLDLSSTFAGWRAGHQDKSLKDAVCTFVVERGIHLGEHPVAIGIIIDQACEMVRSAGTSYDRARIDFPELVLADLARGPERFWAIHNHIRELPLSAMDATFLCRYPGLACVGAVTTRWRLSFAMLAPAWRAAMSGHPKHVEDWARAVFDGDPSYTASAYIKAFLPLAAKAMDTAEAELLDEALRRELILCALAHVGVLTYHSTHDFGVPRAVWTAAVGDVAAAIPRF